MKIVIVTDAWNQINGVVRTLEMTTENLKSRNHDVLVIEPSLFKTIKAPKYPEIQLSINPWRIKKIIKNYKPDAIHIATEGPLGFFCKLFCDKNKIPYTTSYHTKWPEFIRDRWPIHKNITYSYLKWFHRNAKSILVTTQTMKNELENYGFKNMIVWSRGVDQKLFNPCNRVDLGFSKPILGYVGRISVEKNIEQFLNMDFNGTKIVIGDGPEREKLEKKYKDVIFVGVKTGIELAQYYASLDVMVFPSLKDTFGVVIIEANSSGTPVAAYPVTGPIDIIENELNGYLHTNLKNAVEKCLKLDRDKIRDYSFIFSWEKCTNTFLNTLSKIK